MSTQPGEDFGYRIRQLMQKAVRPLRDAEDMARIERPGWPTADRIRDIYEQITDDILNGRTSVLPLKQRLEVAIRERDEAQEALRDIAEWPISPTNGTLDAYAMQDHARRAVSP